MATRPPVANVMRYTLVFRYGGEWCKNVIHVKHPSVPTQAMIDADRGVIHGWIDANWREVAETEAIFKESRASYMGTDPPTHYGRLVHNPPSGRAGLRVDPQGGLANTLSVSLRTGLTTDSPRPPRGRIFHVGGHLGSLADGDTTNAISEFVTRYTALLTGFTNTGNIGQLVVVSYWDGGTRAAPQLRPTPLALPVTRIKIDAHVKHQRRRSVPQPSFSTN